jgi:hypothetical protein
VGGGRVWAGGALAAPKFARTRAARLWVGCKCWLPLPSSGANPMTSGGATAARARRWSRTRRRPERKYALGQTSTEDAKTRGCSRRVVVWRASHHQRDGWPKKVNDDDAASSPGRSGELLGPGMEFYFVDIPVPCSMRRATDAVYASIQEAPMGRAPPVPSHQYPFDHPQSSRSANEIDENDDEQKRDLRLSSRRILVGLTLARSTMAHHSSVGQSDLAHDPKQFGEWTWIRDRLHLGPNALTRSTSVWRVTATNSSSSSPPHIAQSLVMLRYLGGCALEHARRTMESLAFQSGCTWSGTGLSA